jgi:Ni,Fe-hydrogenase III large subunit
MPQEQLCRCEQIAGTNSDCEICRFVATERSLREQLKSEAHGHKQMAMEVERLRKELADLIGDDMRHDI